VGAFDYWKGNWDGALSSYEAAVEAAERSGNVVEAANTRAAIAEVMVAQRRASEALELSLEAERVVRASNAEQILPFVLLQKARALGLVEGPESAVELLQPLFENEMSANASDWSGEIAVALASSLLRAGRSTASGEVLDRFTRAAPEAAEWVAPALARVRAAIALEAGDSESASAHLDEALRSAAEGGDQYEELLALELSRQLATELGSEFDPSSTTRLQVLYDRLGVYPEPVAEMSAVT
jgi:tetratricopeptide (TPR) repeat protein